MGYRPFTPTNKSDQSPKSLRVLNSRLFLFKGFKDQTFLDKNEKKPIRNMRN